MSVDYRWTSLDNMSPLDSWYYKDKFGARFYNPKDDDGFQTDADANDYVHSFRTFGLMPSKKPVISPAKPKTNIVSLEGASTSIDFTEALTGRVEYERRQGTFRYVTYCPRRFWDEILSDVSNALNGKRKWIFLDETPDWFYDGRLTVGNPEYKKDRMYLTITADLEPFKKSANSTLDRWRWDPFNLVNGIIPHIYDSNGDIITGVITLPSGQTSSVNFKCGSIPSTFKIIVESQATNLDVTLKRGGSTIASHNIRALVGGEFEFFDFVTAQGNNVLEFDPHNEQIALWIDYRELSL